MEILSELSIFLHSINSSKTIFVIGGKRLDRGLSITSIDHSFYANCIIYVKSKTCRFSAIDQGLGRVFGVSNDNNARFIYSSEKVFEEMRNGYNTTKSTIDGAIENAGNMSDVIKTGYIPNKLDKIIMCSAFNRIDQRERAPIIIRDHDDNDNDIDSCKKHLLKNIKNALKRVDESIVIKIIKYMKNNPETRSRSVNDLKLNCNVSDINHYTEWKKKAGRYMILINTVGDLYELNPDITDIIKIIN